MTHLDAILQQQQLHTLWTADPTRINPDQQQFGTHPYPMHPMLCYHQHHTLTRQPSTSTLVTQHCCYLGSPFEHGAHRQHQVPSNTQTSTLAPPATMLYQHKPGPYLDCPEVKSPTATIPWILYPLIHLCTSPICTNSTLHTLGPGAPSDGCTGQESKWTRIKPHTKQATDKQNPFVGDESKQVISAGLPNATLLLQM